MSFLGRWFSDAIRIALTLAGALLFMQAPALSHDYAAALRQVADAGNRDIAGREATARGFYPDLRTASDADLLAALRTREPSNAAGLAQTAAGAAAMGGALDRIAGSPPLLQPLAAAWDLLAAPDGGKRAVAMEAVRSFAPALQLSVAAGVWALAGIVAGSFLAQVLLLPFSRRRYMPRARM